MTRDEEFEAAVQLLEDNCRDTENVILFDGRGFGHTFLGALIGTTHAGNAVYDYNKMVECLMDEGLTEEEAIEDPDYNALGSLSGCYKDGELWPVILYPFEYI